MCSGNTACETIKRHRDYLARCLEMVNTVLAAVKADPSIEQHHAGVSELHRLQGFLVGGIEAMDVQLGRHQSPK